MTLNLALYIKVGLMLGFVQVTVYEIRFEYNIVIFGPKKYLPTPFDKLAKLDDNTGLMTVSLKDEDVSCESKGGTVGAESISCWESRPTKSNPMVVSYDGVKSVQVSSGTKALSMNCILSGIGVSRVCNCSPPLDLCCLLLTILSAIILLVHMNRWVIPMTSFSTISVVALLLEP